MTTSKDTEKNKKRTKSKNQKPNTEKQQPSKKSPDKGTTDSKNSGCATTLLIIIVIFLFFSCNKGTNKDSEIKENNTQTESTKHEENNNQTETEEPIEDEKPTETKTDAYGWTIQDHSWFKTITKAIADNYVTNYKVPFFEKWSFAKFDESGKIFATTKFSFENDNQKQPVICIFTLGEDLDGDGYSDSYTAHFLSIGDNIYINDGSCDEFFQNLQNIIDSSNG